MIIACTIAGQRKQLVHYTSLDHKAAVTQEHSNQIKKSNEKFETADLNPAIDTFSAEAYNHKSTAPESGPCAASAPSVIPTSLYKFCVTIILNFNDRLPTAFKKNTLHQEDHFSVDFTG